MVGTHLHQRTRRWCRDDADAPPALDQQIEGEPAFEHRAGRSPGRLHQGPLHLGAGRRTPRVHHPGAAVAALAGERQHAGFLAVELHTEGDQLVDPVGPLVHQHPDGVLVAEPGTGGQGVGQVEVG